MERDEDSSVEEEDLSAEELKRDTFDACYAELFKDYTTFIASTKTPDGRLYDTSDSRYYKMYENLQVDRNRFLEQNRARMYAPVLTLIPSAVSDKVARAVPAFLHCPCTFCVTQRATIFDRYVGFKCGESYDKPAMMPDLELYFAVCLREILLNPCLFVQADDPRIVPRPGESRRPTGPREARLPYVPRIGIHPPFTCLLFEYFVPIHENPAVRAGTVQDRVSFWKIFGTNGRMTFNQFLHRSVDHIALPDALSARITDLTAGDDARNVPLVRRPRIRRAAAEEESDGDL
jgi:hypothetical protein